MKAFSKFFIVVSAVLLITAAGCSGGVSATYGTNWFQNGGYTPNAKQVYTYSVKSTGDFSYKSYNYAKKDNDKVTVTYSDGTYKTTVSAVTNLPEELKGLTAHYNSAPSKFYKIESDFSINVSYDYGESKVYSFNDSIKSVCYLTDTDYNLQPIAHEKQYNTTSLSVKEYRIIHNVYDTKAEYGKDKAALNVTDRSEGKGVYENDDYYALTPIDAVNENISYSSSNVLDNEELLFAIRALPLAKNYKVPVNVLDATTRSVKSVAITTLGEEKLTTDLYKNFTINDVKKESDATSVETYLVSVVLNEQLGGSPKFCYYQKGVKAETERAILVKMIDRLPNNLGALEYELVSVDITE